MSGSGNQHRISGCEENIPPFNRKMCGFQSRSAHFGADIFLSFARNGTTILRASNLWPSHYTDNNNLVAHILQRIIEVRD